MTKSMHYLEDISFKQSSFLSLLQRCLFLTSPEMCEAAKVLLCIPPQQPRATPLFWLIMAFQKTEHLLAAIFTLYLIPSPLLSSGGAELSWRCTVRHYGRSRNLFGNINFWESCMFSLSRQEIRKYLDINSAKMIQNELVRCKH